MTIPVEPVSREQAGRILAWRAGQNSEDARVAASGTIISQGGGSLPGPCMTDGDRNTQSDTESTTQGPGVFLTMNFRSRRGADIEGVCKGQCIFKDVLVASCSMVRM
ncbi:hypothetical protein PsYK624_134400 [Phanerochaete sordida]|uniref:Uncharacterized protein n=1 Tax=Phanerochaete sordida TaxID=48140 RepID=A0A9P3LKG6_9APHY|nr:hypothetical protein PsYK624_134400 [Phanerochaete sordida]